MDGAEVIAPAPLIRATQPITLEEIGAGLEGAEQRAEGKTGLLRGELDRQSPKSPGKCAELVGIGAGLEGAEQRVLSGLAPLSLATKGSGGL